MAEYLNGANEWRIEIARKIAPIYARIADIRAVVLIGGVARGRGDRYSDVDLAVFWSRAPLVSERRAAMAEFETALNTPVVTGEFTAIPVLGSSDEGMLWEEAAYIGGDEATGFKIDVNHRTISAMDCILDDVMLHWDTRGHKLEVMYSIQRVLTLHGENLVREWQRRAATYPAALTEKLVIGHLSQLKADLAMHARRGDLLLFYQGLTTAQHHLLAALLALNHIYRPELKRLADLCEEMTVKPDNLAERVNGMLQTEPEQALLDLDRLAEEVFTLVGAYVPQVETEQLRAKFRLRRQPYDESPVEIG